MPVIVLVMVMVMAIAFVSVLLLAMVLAVVIVMTKVAMMAAAVSMIIMVVVAGIAIFQNVAALRFSRRLSSMRPPPLPIARPHPVTACHRYNNWGPVFVVAAVGAEEGEHGFEYTDAQISEWMNTMRVCSPKSS